VWLDFLVVVQFGIWGNFNESIQNPNRRLVVETSDDESSVWIATLSHPPQKLKLTHYRTSHFPCCCPKEPSGRKINVDDMSRKWFYSATDGNLGTRMFQNLFFLLQGVSTLVDVSSQLVRL